MEMFVIMVRGSIVSLILGVAVFAYYLRTRNRWAWTVAVALMTIGCLGLTMWRR